MSGKGQAKKEQEISRDLLAEVWYSVRHIAFERLLEAFRAKKISRDGFSQKQIADRLGMDTAQLSRIFSGNRNVTLRKLSDIAFAMDHRLEISFKNVKEMAASNESFEYLNLDAWRKPGGTDKTEKRCVWNSVNTISAIGEDVRDFSVEPKAVNINDKNIRQIEH